MALGVEWDGAGKRLRRGIRLETRYVLPSSLDRLAVWIATAAPFLATLVVLTAL